MAADPLLAPVTDLAARIRRGDLSPTALVEATLDRIDAREEIDAYVSVTADRAREAARAAERELAADGPVGPLHGVPVAIKDSTAAAGVRRTWGTTLLADAVADADDPIVSRLREAGAIVVGKTNLPEFALMGGTDNELVGPTRNPFDRSKMVGGSSGGSAAAVADGQAPIAHGTDGGGSLRVPAATCHVYTIKPTFGTVGGTPTGRPNAFAHTPMQSPGPLARTVADAALFLDVVAGPHPGDPLCLPDRGTNFRAATDRSIDGAAVAYSPALDLYPIDPRVRAVVDDAVTAFEAAGARVDRVAVDFDYTRTEITDAFMLGSTVATAAFGEALAADHGIDVLGDDGGAIIPHLVEQFAAGHEYSALDYRRADRVRTGVFDAIQDVFADYDLLVSATMLVPPFDVELLRECGGPRAVDGVPLDDSRWGTVVDWRTTQIFNMTGHPAANVPAGFTDDGLPVGLQVVGPRFADEAVLAASAAFERVRPWRDAYEPLF
ncbi:amidase [Halobacteriales archaeon QS_1_68_17]|nr:MAG: amidase [Halobacteriales archaeon QS_1_68_17]